MRSAQEPVRPVSFLRFAPTSRAFHALPDRTRPACISIQSARRSPSRRRVVVCGCLFERGFVSAAVRRIDIYQLVEKRETRQGIV